MPAFSAASKAGLLSLFLAAATLSAQTTPATATSSGMSKVRIVRFSRVRGSVEVDQGTGRGFEPAIKNLPVVESDRIRTGVGIAEVEFEDDSTLRLTPRSEVDFTELERTASGAAVTVVRLVRGMAYVSLVKKTNGDFTVEFGPNDHLEKLQLGPSSHIRLWANPTQAELAVLGGSVPVNSARGPIRVSSKRTVSFGFADRGDPAVTKKVAAKSFDAWDRQASEYHARDASLSGFANVPYSYGAGDMDYYGVFSDIAGCGRMWLPYFAGASWDPYGNGMWAWYQGVGYSWVSPYPWGWMPYHYGAWSYCPGTGWGWVPGGAWNGLKNVPSPRRIIGGKPPSPLPRPPSHPPGPGGPVLIVVNTTPLIRSGISRSGSFVFVRGSAGLGIPREGLGSLRSFSRNSLRHGVAITPVYLTLNAGARHGRSVAGDFAPVAVHRGYAPPAQMSSMGFASRGSSGNAGDRPDDAMSARMTAVSPMQSGAAAGGSGGGRPK
jgi:hypothetical protein